MKTKFNGILTLLLALVVQVSFAQERTISGIVSDETGPLPGVSVLKKGTTLGTETDFDGKYNIQAKTGDVLVFSFVGMETIERTVSNSNSINVTMKNGNVLEEVVITGLGIKRDKKSLGFAQQSVKGEDLVKSKETDISNALAGKISGVQIVGNNSSTFGKSQIKLRGETNVLYVVDGIKVYSSSDINPDNIADISVLKGGSATAIYGPQGVNGVVVITTKKGEKGKAIFQIDHSSSINSVANLPEYQNEYGGGYKQTWNTFKYDPNKDPANWASFDGQKIPEFGADESWGPKLDGTLVRHWDSWLPGSPEFGKLRAWSPTKNDVNNFYKQALTNNTTFSFSKADDNYNIRSSITYIDQDGIIPNSNRKTGRAQINASYNITEDLEVYTNINYESRSTLNNPDQNYGNLGSNFNQWWQRQLDFDRLKQYEANGVVFSWNIKSPRSPEPAYWDMPYFHSYENIKNQTKNATFGKVGANYNITDNLFIKAEIRKSFNSYKLDDRATTKSNLDPSFFKEEQKQIKRNEFFSMLTYEKSLLDDNADINVSFGGEFADYTYNRVGASTSGGLTIPGFYNLKASKDPAKVDTRTEKWESRGLFAKTSFGFKSMFYLDASYRLDWKSTANPKKNRVDSYGVSGSFLVHKVLPKNNILSFAKARLGYSTSPYFPKVYKLNPVYDSDNGGLYKGNGTMSVSKRQGNPNLTGGTRKELEAGVELNFINNRISLDATYFVRKDTDLPVDVKLDGATGYEEITVNSGQTTSKGIELALSGDIIRTEDFRFNLGANFATLQKVVDFIYKGIGSRDISTYTSRMKLQERVGEEWGVFYGTGFALDGNGNKIIKKGKKGYSYAQQKNKKLGSLLPDFTGGINASFDYKNIGLSFGFDYQVGGKYYSRTERYYIHSGLAPITAGLNDKGNPKRDPVADGGGVHIKGVLQTGTKDGVPISDGTVVDTYNNAKDWYGLSRLGNIYENNLHDASYFKLRTIRLNYRLPKRFLNQINLEAMSIGVFANNVWLISSDLPWVDPSELEKRNEINWAENGTLPSTRSVGVNLKLTF